MPPRKKRQRAGAINYLKRKDIAVKVTVEAASGSGGARVEEGQVSGGVRVEEGQGSGGARVEEGQGCGGARVEEGQGSGGARVVEGQGSSTLSNKDADLAKKLRRLSEISHGLIVSLGMICSTWLCYCMKGYQPYSDSRRLTQLLLLERFYTRTSAQSDVGWMTLCPMEGSSQSPSKATMLETTHSCQTRNCVRERESICGKMLLHEEDPTSHPQPSVSG